MNYIVDTQQLFESSDVLVEAIVTSNDALNPQIHMTLERIKKCIQLVRPFVSLRRKHQGARATAADYFRGASDFFPEHSHYKPTEGIHVFRYTYPSTPQGLHVVVRKSIFQILLKHVKDEQLPWIMKYHHENFSFEDLMDQPVLRSKISTFGKTVLDELALEYVNSHPALFV